MFDFGLPQLALLLTIVLLIVGGRHFARGGRPGDDIARLREELRGHMPVYSAETTRGQEAEFIRDRLPKKIPAAVLIVVLLLGAAAWWLGR